MTVYLLETRCGSDWGIFESEKAVAKYVKTHLGKTKAVKEFGQITYSVPNSDFRLTATPRNVKTEIELGIKAVVKKKKKSSKRK